MPEDGIDLEGLAAQVYVTRFGVQARSGKMWKAMAARGCGVEIWHRRISRRIIHDSLWCLATPLGMDICHSYYPVEIQHSYGK